MMITPHGNKTFLHLFILLLSICLSVDWNGMSYSFAYDQLWIIMNIYFDYNNWLVVILNYIDLQIVIF